MTEYIKREAVEKIIEKGLNNPDKSKAYGYDAVEILGEIHYMDAADVAEVRHGKWIEHHRQSYLVHPMQYDEYGSPVLQDCVYYECSECGRTENKKEPYCHCGAKMDGKGVI